MYVSLTANENEKGNNVGRQHSKITEEKTTFTRTYSPFSATWFMSLSEHSTWYSMVFMQFSRAILPLICRVENILLDTIMQAA